MLACMRRPRRRAVLALTFAALALLTASCAGPPARPATVPPLAYAAAGDDLFARYAPVFVPQYTELEYNRIGAAAARASADGGEEIYIDTARPVFYVQRREFETENGRYTNLVYRVHFSEIPLSLMPFNLTAGRNVGLIVVVTLNARMRPVLLSTVHACGCYLGMIPTSFLDPSAYPRGWNSAQQKVFGETLPGRLDYPRDAQGLHPVIRLRHGTHRVMDVGLARLDELAPRLRVRRAELAPMSALEHLPLDGATTSFYRQHGPLRGHVKGTFKPFELLLMSWWALDPGVGVDKQYGPREKTGTVFYTSLKPWNRSASDMWLFPDFLAFWGWGL